MTRVAVIMGGWSSERPVSLSSGKGMAEAARQSGFDVVEIDVTRQLAQQLEQAKPDVVLNALHGPWGEDGCVQGILEIMGIPYTHSGVLASALAMDKDKARAIYVQHGLDVAEGGMSLMPMIGFLCSSMSRITRSKNCLSPVWIMSAPAS